MPTMLPIAQTSVPMPEMSFVWQAILLGVFILMVTMLVLQIRGSIKGSKNEISPNPLEVKAATEYATKQSVEKLGARVDSNHEDVMKRIAALDESRRTSVSKVYDFTRTELAGARKEQREDITTLRNDMRDDMRSINDRLNDISEALGGTRGELRRVPGAESNT